MAWHKRNKKLYISHTYTKIYMDLDSKRNLGASVAGEASIVKLNFRCIGMVDGKSCGKSCVLYRDG